MDSDETKIYVFLPRVTAPKSDIPREICITLTLLRGCNATAAGAVGSFVVGVFELQLMRDESGLETHWVVVSEERTILPVKINLSAGVGIPCARG